MILIRPGGGEVIGDAPDRRVEILCEHDALHVTWSRFAPGRDGADLHIHRDHTDFFYVLEGELTVKLADGDRVVPAGSLVRVPPFVAHGFANGSETELRYLNLHAPGTGFADYMRGLRDGHKVAFDQEEPPANGTRPAPELVVDPEDVDEIGISEESGDAEGPCWLYVLDGGHAGSWLELPAGTQIAVPGRSLKLCPRA